MGTFNDEDLSYAPFYTMLICFVVFVIFGVYALIRLLFYVVSTFTDIKTCAEFCGSGKSSKNMSKKER